MLFFILILLFFIAPLDKALIIFAIIMAINLIKFLKNTINSRKKQQKSKIGDIIELEDLSAIDNTKEKNVLVYVESQKDNVLKVTNRKGDLKKEIIISKPCLLAGKHAVLKVENQNGQWLCKGDYASVGPLVKK